jgi:hypothetical protein
MEKAAGKPVEGESRTRFSALAVYGRMPIFPGIIDGVGRIAAIDWPVRPLKPAPFEGPQKVRIVTL